jgi:hypoxanthine phosphoribosyltransferase
MMIEKSIDGHRVLLTAKQIEQRIDALAIEIHKHFYCANVDEIVLVAILDGALVFAADLMRKLSSSGLRIRFDSMGLSSYGAATESSGEVRTTKDLRYPIGGRHVLVVEDIVDTGLTMEFLVRSLQAHEPASITVAALLDKPSRRAPGVKPQLDFVGFEIDNHFVIGYGLDSEGGYHRDHPDILIFAGGDQ